MQENFKGITDIYMIMYIMYIMMCTYMITGTNAYEVYLQTLSLVYTKIYLRVRLALQSQGPDEVYLCE